MPTVSIIIPTKNRCELLKECLASVQAQTFEDWEAIVCDDGSTDGTAALVELIGEADSRIRWMPRDPERPSGAPARRNDGIRNANGAFIVFLDDDDVLLPSCLRDRVAVLNAHSEADFCVSDALIFRDHISDPNTRSFDYVDCDDPALRFICHDWAWQTTAPMYRSACVAKTGDWNQELEVGQDPEFCTRCLLLGHRFVSTGKADYGWRHVGPGVGARHTDPRHQRSHVIHAKALAKRFPQQFSRGRYRRALALKFYHAAFHAPKTDRISIYREAEACFHAAGASRLFAWRLRLLFATTHRFSQDACSAIIALLCPLRIEYRRNLLNRIVWRSWRSRNRALATTGALAMIWFRCNPLRQCWVACIVMFRKPPGHVAMESVA